MYIHSYQINNVLNVYRKQLSQTFESTGKRSASAEMPQSRVTLSAENQRQSIIDQVSAEIVDRMARNGPKNQFEEVLGSKLNEFVAPVYKKSEFTYTVIDENNHKRTNILPIDGFRPSIERVYEQAVEAEE